MESPLASPSLFANQTYLDERFIKPKITISFTDKLRKIRRQLYTLKENGHFPVNNCLKLFIFMFMEKCNTPWSLFQD
jgi:hypothetical protein